MVFAGLVLSSFYESARALTEPFNNMMQYRELLTSILKDMDTSLVRQEVTRVERAFNTIIRGNE
jgi:hypothetical protein